MKSIDAQRLPETLRPRARRLGVGGAIAGMLAISAVVLAGHAPVAWCLLGVCAAVTLGALAVTLAEGRYFEPLTVAVVFAAAAFVVRPFDLFLNSTALISYVPPSAGTSTVDSLLRLDNSELALFATLKLHGALAPALTRAVGACAVFVFVFVAAYLLPWGQFLARRLVTTGRARTTRNVGAAIVIALVAGVLGQAAVVLRTGGLSRAANSQLAQKALTAGLVYYVLAGFAVVGVIVWAAWIPPRTRAVRVAFAVAVLEPCIFYLLVGSRTHVLAVALALVIVAHYRWRRLRLREVVVAFVLGLVLAMAMLAVRQATRTKPFTQALSSAPAYVVDPRGVLNNLTQFDQLFYATSSIGVTLPFKHGAWLGQAFASYIPHVLDPSKPEPPDITFRKDVFGNTVGAGRPPTLIGDLYFDFGFAGIVVGAAIAGVIGRALLGLLADADAPGRPFRIALYSLSVFVFFELLSNGYAIAIGYVLTLIVPLLITVLIFGRVTPGLGRFAPRSRSLDRVRRESTASDL